MQEVEDRITPERTAPLVALRGLTVFPNMTVNFEVGRETTRAALETALRSGRDVFLTAQTDMFNEDPGVDDLYRIGTVARVRQLIRTQGDGGRAMVEGLYRAKFDKVTAETPFREVTYRKLNDLKLRESPDEVEAMIRYVRELFGEYNKFAPRAAGDVEKLIFSENDPGRLADFAAQNTLLRYEDRQKILEQRNPYKRLQLLAELIYHETSILGIETEINGKTRESIEKNQREYFMRQQIKVIQRELGDDEDGATESENYTKRINELKLSEECTEKLTKEAGRLAKMSPNSPESAVVRTYLDACLALPWNTETEDSRDIAAARKRLDADHYGLAKVKERVLEFLAVRAVAKDGAAAPSQILCLAGPPGVGKTSIGMSLAAAMGRKTARVSLGGVRDEADIRGHRKTYIGAMPGRIIDAVTRAGTKNPVILLDEIDKLGSDYRGDPASALLEALDGEQNHAFRDHYIELPFDLSRVLFVTTANTLDTIPRPLLDRMEVIELPGYTDEEKLRIAKKFLVKKQEKRNGLEPGDTALSDEALRAVIDGYTRESGVRTLEREIAALCRKAAMAKAERMSHDGAKSETGASGAAAAKESAADGEVFKPSVAELSELLGPAKYRRDPSQESDEVGVANGLAWTSVGGETLPVEVEVMPGSGKQIITGNLGDVMKESVAAAVTCVRVRADGYGIAQDFYEKKDVHFHFPEGAVPKDGPSAGVTIVTALVSALTGRPVRHDLAMTGEVTIRGRVLPIGGLREKTMAALRAGKKTVLIPAENEPDLAEIDANVRSALEFKTAKTVDDVLAAALTKRSPVVELREPEKVKVPLAEVIPAGEIYESVVLNTKGTE